MPLRVYGLGMEQNRKRTIWVHPASYTFSLDEPERILETIWGERPGWGFLRRKDMWIKQETTVEELLGKGYVLKNTASAGGACACPTCGMHIEGIPGNLVAKHMSECAGAGEDWQSLENTVIDEVRIKLHLAKILAEKLRIEKELEEAEKRERFERIREENLARQRQKDRKARLKRETREELRK